MKTLIALLLLAVSGSALADPISAVIAIGTIATTGGAVVAGTATLLGGLAFAGASLSLVGNITGNKSLARIGSLVGAGAGFASLAQGALGAASAADTARSGLDAASAEANAAGASYEAGAAGAGAAGAGAEALTATPVDGVAQASDAAAAADPLADASRAATEAGSQYAAGGPAADLTDGNPLDARLASGAAGSPSNPATGSLTDNVRGVGKFVKDNKELFDVGGGLVKGAMGAIAEDPRQKLLRMQIQDEQNRRNQYSASVQGAAKVPFRVNPNTQVTQVNPQDPIRYQPVRGLVNSSIPGATQ